MASGIESSQPFDLGAIERGYCRLHRVAVPTRYPVQPRPDLAIRRPLIVATRPGQELLCNCEHSGPHLWPDGDEAGDWDDGSGLGVGDSGVPEEPVPLTTPEPRIPSPDPNQRSLDGAR